jgi:hypothetical protein
LRPPLPGAPGQEIEDARSVEKLANARAGVRDSQFTVRGRGHIEKMNELADTAGVYIRHAPETELDSPNAVAEDGVHRPP